MSIYQNLHIVLKELDKLKNEIFYNYKKNYLIRFNYKFNNKNYVLIYYKCKINKTKYKNYVFKIYLNGNPIKVLKKDKSLDFIKKFFFDNIFDALNFIKKVIKN